MKGIIARSKLFSSLALSLALLILPIAAYASTVTTTPLLPADRGTCSTITSSSVKPYIYNGELHSFDVTIGGTKAVAIGGSVGDKAFGYEVINRLQTPAGTKVHVNLPSTRVGASIPVQVTFMYSEGNQVCVSVVKETIQGSSVSYETITQDAPVVKPAAPTYTQNAYAPEAPTAPKAPVAPLTATKNPIPKVDVSAKAKPSSTSTTNVDKNNNSGSSALAATPAVLGALSSVTQMCSNGHASRLWIVLLVLYALFVLALLLQKPDVFGKRTNEWSSGLILVLFLGLLGFWYMASGCRAGPWVPAVATLIACAGLIVLSRWSDTE